MTTWSATPLRTARLELEPLRVEHADEMVTVLADPALYAVIGGEPPTRDALHDRYSRQIAGPPGGGEAWLNWVARRRDTGEALGYVQSTVTGEEAELAWVVGTAHQRLGYAAEAAAAVAAALADAGARVLSAYVAPGHASSEGVARRLGLAPTRETRDGEVRWEAAAETLSRAR